MPTSRTEVLIVGAFGFPNGYGASARALAYASGLQRAGANARIICLKPTETADAPACNLNADGIHKGVAFSYTCGSAVRGRCRIWNYVLYLKGLTKACWQIWQTTRKTCSTVILAHCGDDSLAYIFLLLSARISGACILAERSEFPFVYPSEGVGRRLWNLVNNRLVYPNLDGLIVISKHLELHFSGILKGQVPTLRIPIMVDMSRFTAHLRVGQSTEKKVVYCGNCDHPDEVERVIGSFIMASRLDDKWNLEVVGEVDGARRASLDILIKERKISSRVEFVGRIRADEVPGRLMAASILVLPRAWGKFSEAGFPTKLGEYLATGRPVVVSGTGDIPFYLADKVNAYLVMEEGTLAFAETLRYVMSHLEEASLVGLQGRVVAERNFDVEVNCQKVVAYIEPIIAKRRHWPKK